MKAAMLGPKALAPASANSNGWGACPRTWLETNGKLNSHVVPHANATNETSPPKRPDLDRTLKWSVALCTLLVTALTELAIENVRSFLNSTTKRASGGRLMSGRRLRRAK